MTPASSFPGLGSIRVPGLAPTVALARTLARALTLAVALVSTGPAVARADAPAPGTPPSPGDHGRSAADLATEEFLAHANVVSREPIGKGTTGSLRLVLERGDRTGRAIFKLVDRESHEPTRTNRMEMSFTDCHIYEAAAYRVDRLFGIGLVPPSVPREIDGTKGTVQLWVEDATDFEELIKTNTMPPDVEGFRAAQSAMTVLDVLILNIDRNAGNVLVTMADGKVHAVDHSRSFRLDGSLPKLADWNLKVSPALAARLREVTKDDLQAVLGDLLSTAQIAAVEKRRRALVKKLEQLKLI